MGERSSPGFLAGGGELGALMRAKDWSATPLGEPESWPQSLKTAVRIMLTSRQPIWIGWGPDLIYLYNDPYKAIIGGKHPDALGQPTKIVWREIWGDIGPMLATAMRGDEGTYVEEQLLIMERNGYPEETYYTFSYSPIPDDDGTAGGIICANTDDTRRVIGERQITLLRDVAARTADARTALAACRASIEAIATNQHDLPFAALYLESDDGFILGGLSGIEESHPQFPAHLSADDEIWPCAETLRRDEVELLEALSDERKSELPTGAWEVEVSRVIAMPIAAAADSGQSAILIAGLNPYRLFDESYRGFLNLLTQQIGTSIANAEAYEAERKRAEALAEIDKAKTAFFSNVSHEFRTPLTLMLGPLEDAIASSGDLPEKHRERVELAHRNSLRLLRLVNSLLDFSRIEAGRVKARFQKIDIAALTTDLVSSFRAATDKAGLALTVQEGRVEGDVYLDRDMWEKIILNLLSNAFKFTFEGEISVSIEDMGDAVSITVADTGTGIPESELPFLFERFHRVEGAKGRSYEGSGIGLALVRELVQQHGGAITAESELGKGSAFTVEIPKGRTHLPADQVLTDPIEAIEDSTTAGFVEEALRWLPGEGAQVSDREVLRDLAESRQSASNEAHAHSILLADDNADLRDYIGRLLSDRGYSVQTVADGEAALAALREDRPDLLITDVMMPGMDGFALLHEIRGDAALRDLSVIMLSARSGEESRVEGLDAGADDYLTKPFSARELIARVESHLTLIRQRRDAMSALRESEARFRNMADHSPLMMWVTNADAYCTYLNRAWYEFTGQEEAQALGFGWLDAVHPDDREWSGETFRQANAERASFRLEYRLRHRDGSYRWAIDAASPRYSEDGEFLGYIGSVLDIDDRKRQENLRKLQNHLLELAIEDRPLEGILEELVVAVEEHSHSGMKGSVLLMDADGQHLLHGAAPSLPDTYTQAIDGITIGEGVGSCGTAAFTGKPVYVSDIATDPLWKDFKDLALAHGLAACWSTPILATSGEVLGTFALYYSEPREPIAQDLEVVDFVTQSASLVIERKRAQDALTHQARHLETLNRTGAAVAAELELERVVQTVTDAGVELTGAAFGAFFYNVESESGESYMLYALSGVERSAFEQFPMPRNTKIFAPTFGGEGIIRSDDITRHANYGLNKPNRGMPEGHLPVRSYLAVPVMSRSGEVIGGLFFGHPEPARFTERHEQLMEGIAGQAAIAIDNARLFQSAQREITQRKAAESALQKLNDDLEARVREEIVVRREAERALHRAQRMESIGQLTGGIAHDFNNLLQVISGNLQLLSRDVADHEKAGKRVQNALTGVSRGAKLASQLLAFGRRQPLEPKVINIGHLTRGLEDMLHTTLGEEIEIETVVEESLWNCLADPSQVENSVLNLAINSRDAMDGRGRIAIALSNARIEETDGSQEPDLAPGEYVKLSVTDTGCGMPDDVIDKVFEPFFTTKPEGRGTGLGLSMVYGFAKQSGGDVTIESRVGEGSTISLFLPRVEADIDEEIVVGTSEAGRGQERVLVVEDDDEVRATATELLVEMGYTVVTATDAADALRIIETDRNFDLLFTDVVMPGPVRSPELAERASGIIPGLAVLYTSGYAQDAIVHEGRLDAGVSLLPKPYTREALARKVRQVLNRAKHDSDAKSGIQMEQSP
jgi:PAS domain S-box-containing protein